MDTLGLCCTDNDVADSGARFEDKHRLSLASFGLALADIGYGILVAGSI